MVHCKRQGQPKKSTMREAEHPPEPKRSTGAASPFGPQGRFARDAQRAPGWRCPTCVHRPGPRCSHAPPSALKATALTNKALRPTSRPKAAPRCSPRNLGNGCRRGNAPGLALSPLRKSLKNSSKRYKKKKCSLHVDLNS